MNKKIVIVVNVSDILDKCKTIIKQYPVDCVQYHKIKEQIETLESEVEK